MKIKVKKCVGVGCVWLNLEKKKKNKDDQGEEVCGCGLCG